MTQPTWAAERVVEPELARTLIRRVAPDLADAPIALLGFGWDNTVYRVADRVARFPRRQMGADLLEREIALLPEIARAMPLRVPAIVAVGAPSPEFPWRYSICDFVPGKTACGLVAERGSLGAGIARSLATALRALHALPVERARALGAPEDELRRADPVHRKQRATAALAALVELEVISETSRATLLSAFDGCDRPTGAHVLLHGDLYARHLLVDGGVLTGIIDWGDVHIGDRAIDLAVAYMVFDRDARAAFFEAYGPLDDTTIALAKMRAVYHEATIARYGIAEADAAMRGAGLFSLAQVEAEL